MVEMKCTVTHRRGVMLVLLALGCTLVLSGCFGSSKRSRRLSDPAPVQFDEARNPKPSAKTLVAMASILSTQGKYAESETLLKSAIHEHPSCGPAYNHLAELYMHQGKLDRAVTTLSLGLQQTRRDPRLLNNLGMCLLIRKDYDKALEAFTEAAAIVPRQERYRANMAVALGLLNRHDEAESLLKQVVTEEESRHNLAVLRAATEVRTKASSE